MKYQDKIKKMNKAELCKEMIDLQNVLRTLNHSYKKGVVSDWKYEDYIRNTIRMLDEEIKSRIN